MSISDPDQPPSGGATGPSAPSGYVGPTAPVPPRSRGRDHLRGALLGVLAGLLAIAALVVSTALTDDGGGLQQEAMVAALVGALVLTAAALWSGRSATAPYIAGGIWAAVGVLGLLPGEPVVGSPNILGSLEIRGRGIDEVAETFVSSGLALVVGLVLLGLGTAASVARHRGHVWERAEQNLRDDGAVTTPPRPRLPGHIAAVLLSAIAAILGVVLVDAMVTERHAGGLPLTNPDVLLPLIVVVVASFTVSATGAMSSLGPTVGALVWLTSAVTAAVDAAAGEKMGLGIVSATFHPLLDDVLGLSEPQSSMAASGVAWVIALVLTGGAVGVHRARRNGRLAQRREVTLVQTQNDAWSDTAG